MDLGCCNLPPSLFPVLLSVLDWEKCLEKVELHNLDWIARPLAKTLQLPRVLNK